MGMVCCFGYLSGTIGDRDVWQECSGNLCYQKDLMIYIYIYIYIVSNLQRDRLVGIAIERETAKEWGKLFLDQFYDLFKSLPKSFMLIKSNDIHSYLYKMVMMTRRLDNSVDFRLAEPAPIYRIYEARLETFWTSDVRGKTTVGKSNNFDTLK